MEDAKAFIGHILTDPDPAGLLDDPDPVFRKVVCLVGLLSWHLPDIFLHPSPIGNRSTKRARSGGLASRSVRLHP